MSGAIQFAAAAETRSALSKKTLQPSPVFSWTGFYLGGNVGGGTSHINFSGTGIFTIARVADPFAFANSGTASGIRRGANWASTYESPAHVVLGFEADLDGSSFHGLTTFCSTGPADRCSGTVRIVRQAITSWNSSARCAAASVMRSTTCLCTVQADSPGKEVPHRRLPPVSPFQGLVPRPWREIHATALPRPLPRSVVGRRE